MTGPAFDRVLDALRAAGRQTRQDKPNHAMAQCPAHEDGRPSLSVTSTESQVLLYCFAGCATADVVAALGLNLRDLYHEPLTGPYGLGEAIRYKYPDGRENWRSTTRKDFRRDDRRAANHEGPKALYDSDRLDGAPLVYVAEGEKDADALRAAGGVAVACPGAKAAAGYDWTPLHGRDVVVVAHRDEAGGRYAGDVVAALAGRARVRVVRSAVGEDAADHVAAGRTLAELEDYPGPQVGNDFHPEPESLDEYRGPEEIRLREPESDSVDLYARLVAERVRALRVERDARAELAREGRDTAPFDAGTLGEVLARPEPPRARVEGLVPWQASALVVAQRKAGKTTWALNLARSLITGAPFLGSLPVRAIAPDARVGFLNYEVSGAQLARWADEVRVPVDRLFLVNVRGRRNPLTDPEDRARLAELLRANRVESLVVDPFGRAFGGASQNDAAEVGGWLVNLDTFARAEVGALDLILTAHAGWNGERTRGSSALEDWADVIITLNRDDETGDRFIRATGRDIELDEDRLDFHPITRTLSLSGAGGRKAAAEDRQDADTARTILALLTANPEGLSGNELAKAARRKDGAFTRVRDALVEDEHSPVTSARRPGKGGGVVYRVQHPEHTENIPNRDLPNLPNLPVLGGGSGSGTLEPNLPSASGRVCADCGAPCAVNRVRCPECLRVLNGGTR